MGIDYSKIKYTTNRLLTHKKGTQDGSIRMYSNDKKEFHFTMVCPVCGAETEGKVQLLKRPYYVPCNKCNTKHVIAKLR